MLKHRFNRGDTLIEVLFAFSILSLVIIGSLAIMNQGSIAAQRALETTLVRQQIDAQATTLKFLHDAYVAQYQKDKTYDVGPAKEWATMSAAISSGNSATDFVGSATCPTPPAGRSFILDSVNAKFINGNGGQLAQTDAVTPIAQVTYQGNPEVILQAKGIWIEAVRSAVDVDANKQNTRYIDFHIMACWPNPGQGPAMTIGTIVRLYEPYN